MHAEKLRNTTPEELRHQEQELSDQLFRLRFQLKMGQSESLKKLRDLRKDIARVKTILRERELGIVVSPHAPSRAAAPAADSAPEVEEKAQKAPVKAAAAKKPAAHSKAKSAGKSSAGKKKSEKK